jgi:superfamily II DNA or RNA helicase/HKD family nuclease
MAGRGTGNAARLHVGQGASLLLALRRELAGCSAASFAVSFVMDSGVSLLEADLRAATLRGARLRLLTTDYLDVTEPGALRRLLGVQPAIVLRAFESRGRAFHPKAWLFERADGSGLAFVGSANLSRSGLAEGVEWTWTVLASDPGAPMVELAQRFDECFESAHTVPVTEAWLRSYESRRRSRLLEAAEPQEPYQNPPVIPRAVQALALDELQRLRDDGQRRALVIAATGLGKTFLAAFDSLGFRRVMFVAHREELLTQAAEAFRAIRPGDSVGWVVAGRREIDRDLVFASVQSLRLLLDAEPAALEGFDYVVVDEFHHAAALTYLEVLRRIEPRFLLGLTATPYRGDNRDLYALCDGNVAYEIGLFAAIGFGWLVPFHYFGVADIVHYGDELLNASRSRYDDARLTVAVNTEARAALVLEQFHAHSSTAALGFCVSIAHAEFMADAFARAGVPALAVHSAPGSADRRTAISDLEAGRARVLFVVDLFNEGVDIPGVDLVMFLRPTESMTVFLQQLGRGLRLKPGKPRLTVLDFIGNYRKAHFKLPFLVGVEDDAPEAIRAALKRLQSGACRFETETGIRVELEPVALEHLRHAIETTSVLRVRLREELLGLAERLGHRPTLLDVEHQCRYSPRQHLRSHGSWFATLRNAGLLTDHELLLEEDCGDFLREIERTAMTRSYKMVVLKSMLQEGGFDREITLERICSFARQHFSHARFRHEVEGTPVADATGVPAKVLEDYLLRNPIQAWTSGGAGDTRRWFSYSEDERLFRYNGPTARDPAAFAAAVQERVEWRLHTHLARPGPGQRLYKVIPNAGGGAIIMLGEENGDGLPRGAGWRVVTINGKSMYAKFAKIAVNTLADRPDGTNQLTAELQVLLGERLLEFKRPYWVSLRATAPGSNVWELSSP